MEVRPRCNNPRQPIYHAYLAMMDEFQENDSIKTRNVSLRYSVDNLHI